MDLAPSRNLNLKSYFKFKNIYPQEKDINFEFRKNKLQ